MAFLKWNLLIRGKCLQGYAGVTYFPEGGAVSLPRRLQFIVIYSNWYLTLHHGHNANMIEKNHVFICWLYLVPVDAVKGIFPRLASGFDSAAPGENERRKERKITYTADIVSNQSWLLTGQVSL